MIGIYELCVYVLLSACDQLTRSCLHPPGVMGAMTGGPNVKAPPAGRTKGDKGNKQPQKVLRCVCVWARRVSYLCTVKFSDPHRLGNC